MPGKPRKPYPGHFRLQELAAEARRRGISISIGGLKRKIASGKLIPDLWEGRTYKPSPLFRQDRLDHWLAIVPKPQLEVPAGMTTVTDVLTSAKRINPKIRLAHIQLFLKREFERMADPGEAIGSFGERHGKRWRLVIPVSLGGQFLTAVRENRLEGLFSGYPHAKAKPTEPEVPVGKPQPRFSFESLGSAIPIEVVSANLNGRRRMGQSSLTRLETARVLGVPQMVVNDLINEKGIVLAPDGKIRLNSLISLLGV